MSNTTAAKKSLPPAAKSPPSADKTKKPAASGATSAPKKTKPKPQPKNRSAPKKRRGRAKLSFFLMVLLPTIIVGFYYYAIASEQFQSEMRFTIRGTNTSPLDKLGLSAIPGNSNQAADAYITIDYINSYQILTDIKTTSKVDMRSYFSKQSIDPIYRIDANMPLEEFVFYWRWMVDSDFNSTTGITTFRVNAFSASDAKDISDSVLKVAKELVYHLSTEARLQLITTAQEEVKRTELRLAKARTSLKEFRNKEQSLNPTLQAESDLQLIQNLQKQLIDLTARRAVLTASVNSNSPSVRVIDRQIAAIRKEQKRHKQNIGSGKSNKKSSRNLSDLLSEYNTLELEQEFAEKSYTTALSSLEKSQAEARKEERYFALVVHPTKPEIALYPYRIINTIIAFGVFLVLWLLFYLIAQAVRDHSI